MTAVTFVLYDVPDSKKTAPYLFFATLTTLGFRVAEENRKETFYKKCIV